MKAFIAGCAAAVVIAVLAAVALQWLDVSSATYFQSDTGNVRL